MSEDPVSLSESIFSWTFVVEKNTDTRRYACTQVHVFSAEQKITEIISTNLVFSFLLFVRVAVHVINTCKCLHAADSHANKLVFIHAHLDRYEIERYRSVHTCHDNTRASLSFKLQSFVTSYKLKTRKRCCTLRRPFNYHSYFDHLSLAARNSHPLLARARKSLRQSNRLFYNHVNDAESRTSGSLSRTSRDSHFHCALLIVRTIDCSRIDGRRARTVLWGRLLAKEHQIILHRRSRLRVRARNSPNTEQVFPRVSLIAYIMRFMWEFTRLSSAWEENAEDQEPKFFIRRIMRSSWHAKKALDGTGSSCGIVTHKRTKNLLSFHDILCIRDKIQWDIDYTVEARSKRA